MSTVLKCKRACLLTHEADGSQVDKKPPGFLMRVFLPTKALVPNLLQAEGGLESGTASEEGTSPISTLGGPWTMKSREELFRGVQKQGQGALVRMHFPPQVSILQGCPAGFEQCPRPLPLSEWHCCPGYPPLLPIPHLCTLQVDGEQVTCPNSDAPPRTSASASAIQTSMHPQRPRASRRHGVLVGLPVVLLGEGLSVLSVWGGGRRRGIWGPEGQTIAEMTMLTVTVTNRCVTNGPNTQ